MALSIRERIAAAVFTTLEAINTITGLTVERARVAPAAVDDLPILVVTSGGQRRIDERETAEIKIYEMDVLIEGAVAGSSVAAADTALNDLYARVVESLESDKSLGFAGSPGDDVVLWSGEGDLDVDMDREGGHDNAAAFLLTWIIRYVTSPTDPYAAP